MWMQNLLRYNSFVKGCHQLNRLNYNCIYAFYWNSKNSRTMNFSRCDLEYRICDVHGANMVISNLYKELVQHIHTSAAFSHKVDKSRVPVLKEEELEEKFVKGSGPGGQKVNKTTSVCTLKHIPTGLQVKCQEERNLHKNRQKAREMMISKLDEYYNGDTSVKAQLNMIKEKKLLRAKQKSQKKKAMKKAWQERENIE